MKKKLLKILIWGLAIILVMLNIALYFDAELLANARQYTAAFKEEVQQSFLEISNLDPLIKPQEEHVDKEEINSRINSGLDLPEPPPSDDVILADNASMITNPGIVGNQWLAVNRYPTSHFSLDIDGSNYESVKDILQQGIVPPRSIIRIESLINYFEYYYKQKNDNRILIDYEVALSPFEKEIYILKLNLKTRPFDPAHDQKDWNIFFAIDNSQALAELAVKDQMLSSLKNIVAGMSSKDRLGLVLFGGEQSAILGSTAGKDRTRILRILNELNFGGTAEELDGDFINKAIEIVAKNQTPKSLNKIIILTANGTKLTDQDILKLKEEVNQNVLVQVVSFQENAELKVFYDNLGQGSRVKYTELNSFDDFISLVNENFLDDSYQVSVKDLISRINFNLPKVNFYKLIGFSNFDAGLLDNIVEHVQVVDLKYNQAVTILYKLKLNRQALEAEDEPLGNLELSYRESNSDEVSVFNKPLLYKSSAKVSEDFNFALAVGYLGEYLSNLSTAHNYNLEAIKKLALKNKGKDANGKRQEFVELLDNVAVAK
ncbi:MAG: von Willebrand factor type A domain-containing protein [Deltaproteobacteria bacterium]|jgi:Ca-activated chloride channel family protein|nr:von Willebrand factor type A domain-containing protein [Deltaproteobacteria bacterium]